MTACLAQTDGFSRYASRLDDASHQPMPSAHQKAPNGLLVTRQERLDRFGEGAKGL